MCDYFSSIAYVAYVMYGYSRFCFSCSLNSFMYMMAIHPLPPELRQKSRMNIQDTLRICPQNRLRYQAHEPRQDDKIIAPMPGKVVKIPVQKGDHLQAGDIVIVLEAMKMQSNYKVNSECIVKDILVNEGDSVNGNQTLVLLDIIPND